ncbi:MAG: hypothetical protein H0W76_26090 [Pyrinomonadaceae bacterium]|nr:hypothetical protein [Pyrinomonadaceae bacterium]
MKSLRTSLIALGLLCAINAPVLAGDMHTGRTSTGSPCTLCTSQTADVSISDSSGSPAMPVDPFIEFALNVAKNLIAIF